MTAEALQNISPPQEHAGVWLGKNHFPRAEPGTLSNSRLLQIDESCFRANDEQAVVRQRVAHRAQAVAVQLRAYVLSIRKDQRGRAVPGFALLRKRGKGTAHITRKQWIVFKSRRHER